MGAGLDETYVRDDNTYVHRYDVRMAISPSALRADIYRILDEVLETGQPIEINRKGRVLRIVLDNQPTSRLDRLVRRTDVIIGDPDDLDEISWEHEWGGVEELDDPDNHY